MRGGRYSQATSVDSRSRGRSESRGRSDGQGQGKSRDRERDVFGDERYGVGVS